MPGSRAFLTMLMIVSLARADDWPQWLGPKRDGGTSEKVAAWKDSLKPLWRTPVGPGHSVPVIAAGRVFIFDRVKDKEEEELFAVDAKTGKELWRTSMRAPYASVLNTGPQATPTVAGNRVFTFGVNGVLTCFKANSGEIVWQVDVYKKFKVDLPRFGVCCSPVVIGNRLIVAVGGKGSSVIAFDTEKGEVQWQALDEPASTGSPVLFAAPGKGADVVFMTTLRVVALNPLDGSLSWEYPLVFQPAGTSPTPLVVGDKVIASTMTNGTTTIRVEGKEEKAVASKLWQVKELAAYFSSGTCVNKDHLYLITNTLKPIPNAALSCVELKTGKELWKKSAVGYFHAGIIRTGDGKLLILDDLGVLKLVEDNNKEYRELCRSKVCNGTLTNPALSNGRVYVRDDKEVICLDLQ